MAAWYKKAAAPTVDFSGVYLHWVFKYIDKNWWRFSSLYEHEDLVQEAAVKFYHCRCKYDSVSEPKHFMSLFKTSVRNHFNDLASSARISNQSIPWMDHMGGIDWHGGEAELAALDVLRSAVMDENRLRKIATISGMSENALQSMVQMTGGSMSEVNPIEVELCHAVGTEPAQNRSAAAQQDFRKNLVEKVDSNLDDSQFDQLSDDAQQWVNAAVEAVINDMEIPDFDGVVSGPTEPSTDETVETDDEPQTTPQVEAEEPSGAEDTAAEPDPEVSAEVGTAEEDSTSGGVDVGVDVATAIESEVGANSEDEKTESTEKEEQAPVTKPAAEEKTTKPPKDTKSKSASKEPKVRKKPAGIRVKEIMLEYGMDLSKEQVHTILLEDGFKMAPSTVDVVRYEFRQAVKLLNEHGMIRPDKDIGGLS